MQIYRPLPIDEEIKLNSKKIIVSKTDKHGKILYVNDYFCEVTGYKANEVIGVPHNIIRHPDMPKAIFYLMWRTIESGGNIQAVVKNLAKSGKYYWVITDFENHRDITGEIESYIAFRRPAPRRVIDAIEELYNSLLDVEKKHGMKASLIYLQGYLDERHTNYNEFINDIIKPRSLMEKLFSLMKKSFTHSNSNNYSNGYKHAV
jgi:PAS domain S-box-containing protein